jgi:uncharacterized protein YodC (DUF2158 family)
MKELNTFREFINESKFKIGDKVTMKSGGEAMEVTDARRMFGSKLNAYSVKKSDGEEVEYDESQLKLVEELHEGVWSVLPDRIPEFIKKIEEIKDEYYSVVGSDDVYDGLDAAIIAAEALLNMELKED